MLAVAIEGVLDAGVVSERDGDACRVQSCYAALLLLIGGNRRCPRRTAGTGGVHVRHFLDHLRRRTLSKEGVVEPRRCVRVCARLARRQVRRHEHMFRFHRGDQCVVHFLVTHEVQESVVQCLDCMHDQPHLTFEGDRVVAIGDRWERMVAGTPWVASCTVQVDQDRVESCSGPEAIEFLTYGAFGDAGVREFFTHVRFHKHDDEQIVIHLLVELYARSAQEATEVLEEAAQGQLEITSLAEESRPPAHASGEAH